MKKAVSILLIIMLLLVISITPVLATIYFTIVLSASSTTIEQGKTVDVTVSLKNFTSGETGINSMKLTIDYDKTVFNTLATTDLTLNNGWGSLTFDSTNGQASMNNSIFVSTDSDMLTIKFTVKSSALAGSTVISIKNVTAGDGTSDILPAEQSITLNVQAATVTPPANNNITVSVNNDVTVSVTNNTTNNTSNNANNNNIAQKNPSTGVEDYTVPAILTISALALLAYARYRKIR